MSPGMITLMVLAVIATVVVVWAVYQMNLKNKRNVCGSRHHYWKAKKFTIQHIRKVDSRDLFFLKIKRRCDFCGVVEVIIADDRQIDSALILYIINEEECNRLHVE